MKIVFLGDSITAGACATTIQNAYWMRLGKILGADVIGYGKSGTRIAKQTVLSEIKDFDEDFQIRAMDMDKTADLIFVFGGTNDWGHGDAKLGVVGDSNPYTFAGAVQNLIYILKKNYKAKIIFILPILRFQGETHYGEFGTQSFRPLLSEYINTEKQVLVKNGVEFLNLNELGLPAPDSNQLCELYQDGLHPTDKGHLLIAELIAEYLNNQYFKKRDNI